MKYARAICDRSGFEFPLSELVREWTGLMVHPSYCDKRNPQDLIRPPRETVLPYTRPEADDTFLSTNEVQPGDL